MSKSAKSPSPFPIMMRVLPIRPRANFRPLYHVFSFISSTSKPRDSLRSVLIAFPKDPFSPKNDSNILFTDFTVLLSLPKICTNISLIPFSKLPFSPINASMIALNASFNLINPASNFGIIFENGEILLWQQESTTLR